MRIFLKILGILAGVVIVVILGGFIYFNIAYPDVEPAPKVKVEQTSVRIERGKYLANHVAVCIDCHSTRDWTKFSGPVKPGTEGSGGDVFGKEVGFPGVIAVKNITPGALSNWSDGDIIRAVTCGVNKDGDALFPVMPYMNFNKMDKEDLYSIVAYLRTLHPVKKNIKERELDFPLNFIVKTIPLKTYKPVTAPSRANSVAYGKYLVTIASCADCHTPTADQKPIPGMDFAGGQTINLPIGTLKSANITPHMETGIGSWTKEQFINRFKAYDPSSASFISVKQGEFNSIMPWTMYAGMTKEDLGAIYDYLRTLKPVYNNVTRFTPPSKSLAAK